MKNVSPYLALILALTACGPLISTTDKPTGLYVAGSSSPGDFGVRTANARPTDGVEMEGISCKNKIWDPTPTNTSAVAVLKREAAQLGFNSVYITKLENDPSPIQKNCWSAIIARGIAFNS